MLESRELLSLTITDAGNAFPTTVTVDAGAPLMLALTGGGASAGATSISFAASSSGAGLAATVMPSTNKIVQITAHTTTDPTGDTEVSPGGTMDFMLFDNYVSGATKYFENLVTSSFYDSAPDDPSAPVINNVGKQVIFRDDPDVLQMGSQNNTNNTGSNGGYATSVNDAYNPNLVYTGADVLAMAKSGNDANNSQFFITNKVDAAGTSATRSSAS